MLLGLVINVRLGPWAAGRAYVARPRAGAPGGDGDAYVVVKFDAPKRVTSVRFNNWSCTHFTISATMDDPKDGGGATATAAAVADGDNSNGDKPAVAGVASLLSALSASSSSTVLT